MSKIPKIIHYCWFGYGAKNGLIQKCIASWKRHLPEYQFKLWDELSFDMNSNLFASQAYDTRKWAFVSDYVRLYALYHEGGIYLDSDVEVYKSLDQFLDHSVFTGFENGWHIPTGIIGAEKGNKWIGRMLEYYSDRSFIKDDGTLEMTPNVQFITSVSVNEYGLKTNNQYQILPDDVHIYPKEYFCIDTGVIDCFTRHHFAGSWLDKKDPPEALLYKKMFLNLRNLLIMDNSKLAMRIQELTLQGCRIGLVGSEVLMYILSNKLMEGALAEIACYIDNNYIGHRVGNIPVIGFHEVNNYEMDAIILPPVIDFREMKNQFRSIYSGRVLSIEDIMSCYVLC